MDTTSDLPYAINMLHSTGQSAGSANSTPSSVAMRCASCTSSQVYGASFLMLRFVSWWMGLQKKSISALPRLSFASSSGSPSATHRRARPAG
ncbi:MAG: transposase [Caudoviricetes sp.]|nr:MAG: transposase [Caudoviricetes sp.]